MVPIRRSISVNPYLKSESRICFIYHSSVWGGFTAADWLEELSIMAIMPNDDRECGIISIIGGNGAPTCHILLHCMLAYCGLVFKLLSHILTEKDSQLSKWVSALCGESMTNENRYVPIAVGLCLCTLGSAVTSDATIFCFTVYSRFAQHCL